jgi:hypothetical protein
MAARLQACKRIVCAAILLLTQVSAQDTTSIALNFQLGPVPASLEASVVTSYTTVSVHATQNVYSYQVDCATAQSPDNDACRALSIYPAIAYQTQGSV